MRIKISRVNFCQKSRRKRLKETIRVHAEVEKNIKGAVC